MLRKSFAVIMFLCSVIQLFSQDGLFRILEDTPVWESTSWNVPHTNSTAARILKKGLIVSNVGGPFISRVNGVRCFVNTITFENIQYAIPANTFTALETEEIFDESFLTNAATAGGRTQAEMRAAPQANGWINAYFLDVLRTGDRNTLIQYEQRMINDKHDPYFVWYDYGDFSQSLVVTQGTISIGGISREEFWIKRINRIPNGYCVRVAWSTYKNNYMRDRDSRWRSMLVNLPEREMDTFFDLYFFQDGYYLDVYYSTGSERIYCTSFALVDSEIRTQLNGIIRHNPHSRQPVPYDPSKITFWPRRADGSMDYPPPAGALLSSNILQEIEH